MDYKAVLEKALDGMQANEQKYSDLAYKSLEKNNVTGGLVMNAQAAGWTGARYLLESLMEEAEED